mgnify:CR=1 FL=1
MEQHLQLYIKQVNLHYNLWRKFRDSLANIKRHKWPPNLVTEITTKLLPLIDNKDYHEFLRVYKELDTKRLEWKYGR